MNPILNQLLHIAEHPGYHERGLQIGQGNILRGRPKYLDSLNICYIIDYITHSLPVNDPFHGGPSAVCADGWGEAFWRGAVVAYQKAGNDFNAKKMMGMTLTAYCDAIDYPGYYRETIGWMNDRPTGLERPLEQTCHGRTFEELQRRAYQL